MEPMPEIKQNAVRIVIIEDNPADIFLFRRAFEQQGEEFDLEVLRDGEAALEFVREHRAGSRKPDPCVIVLDLHLPKYDGMAVLRAIRLEPTLEHVRVAVVTSLANPAEEAQLQDADVQLYRQKPSQLHEFLELGAEIFALCKSYLSARAA